MGLTIIKEVNTSPSECEFGFAKTLVETTNAYNFPYTTAKPAVLFVKKESEFNFYPAVYISAKQIEQKLLVERFQQERTAQVERSHNFDFVTTSSQKIRILLPSLKALFSEYDEIPEVEILFLPEKGKTVMFYKLLQNPDSENLKFIADLIVKIPNIYEKIEKNRK